MTMSVPYENLSINQSANVTLTITSTANATPGTYLLSTDMSGEACIGPMTYFTIGNSQYIPKSPPVIN